MTVKGENNVNIVNFQALFLFRFSNKILIIIAGIHKMLVRIAIHTGKNLIRLLLFLQKQFDLGMHCILCLFGR